MVKSWDVGGGGGGGELACGGGAADWGGWGGVLLLPLDVLFDDEVDVPGSRGCASEMDDDAPRCAGGSDILVGILW